MKRKNMACSLCFQPIDDSTKYNEFKHNTLFALKPGDIWHCKMKHYICEECMRKLQPYCQEGMYAEGKKFVY